MFYQLYTSFGLLSVTLGFAALCAALSSSSWQLHALGAESRGSVNGRFQMLVRVWSVKQISAPPLFIGNGPNTVSGSTVSNTKLSEFFGAHCVLGSELSEFISAYYLCVNANSPSSSQNSPSLPQNSVRLSEFSSPKQYSRNSVPSVSPILTLVL